MYICIVTTLGHSCLRKNCNVPISHKLSLSFSLSLSFFLFLSLRIVDIVPILYIELKIKEESRVG